MTQKTLQNPWTMDVRVRERNLKSGALTDKDLEKTLAALPDLSDSAENFSTPQPALAQPHVAAPPPPPPVFHHHAAVAGSEPMGAESEDDVDDLFDDDDDDSSPDAAGGEVGEDGDGEDAADEVVGDEPAGDPNGGGTPL